MSQHTAISPAEAADRLAIRELVEACAYCADRRDAEGQMALFTPDTHFVVYMDAKNPTPSQELHSREALAPIFADLNKYQATIHFVGQGTISSLRKNHATGQAYCLAHHLTVDGNQRRLICPRVGPRVADDSSTLAPPSPVADNCSAASSMKALTKGDTCRLLGYTA
jgi:SnoaL-like domain